MSVSELVVIGFPDEAGARLAYDEILNLSDNRDLQLEGLALRTTGPTGWIRVEIPDQATVGSAPAGPRLVPFLAGVLQARTGSGVTPEVPPEAEFVLPGCPAVIVIMASHIAWQRFQAAMSFFDGITVALPGR